MADALYRQHSVHIEFASLVTSCGVQWQHIHSFLKKDNTIQQLISQIQAGETVPKGFTLESGVLRYKHRVVIPKHSELTNRLLKEYHDSPVGSHAGDFKTYQRLASEWYWAGMRKDVTKYVQNCHICQQNKVSTLSPLGLLQPLPIPEQVWEDISMDFVEGLPKSLGWDTILVVVDQLTKYGHFILLKHPYTAQRVAHVFVKEVVRLHGMPSSIVSDRDKIFLSIFWKELFRLQGTNLHRSTAYHLQTDGQTEVVNKGVESYLRCFVNGKPSSWASWLHWAEYWYNTAFHTATHCTPFKALYGRDPPHLVRFSHGATAISSLEDQLQERDAILDDLKYHLVQAQIYMKQYENKSRREGEFEVGDLVYLKLQPYRQHSVVRRQSEKLSPRFYGPYQVLERVGRVAYRLQLPATAKIHPIFHISQLKKAMGPGWVPTSLPAQLSADLVLEVESESVLGVRNSQAATEVLIKWKGLQDFEATWEDHDEIAARFPHFHLEDKVLFWVGGIARDQPRPAVHFTYARRRPKQKADREIGAGQLVTGRGIFG